jgi:uncharacterized membrane protein YvlD (DUF360 family)
MRSILFGIAGSLSVVTGLVLLPLPVPFGLPLIMLGLGLFLMASAALRIWFKRWRTRNRGLSDGMLHIEAYLPDAIRRVLEETHPD